MRSRTRPAGQDRPAAAAVAVAAVVALAAGIAGCSGASRTLRYTNPSPDIGVVYVSEQVFGLDDWARSPDSRAYARITTQAGKVEEGTLLRITQRAVVIAPAEDAEVAIDKDRVLFMRVWW